MRSTTMMRRLAGCDYGYAAVLAAAMLHLPFIRMAVRAATEDDAIDRRPLAPPEITIPESYQVVVECRDEADQQFVYERMRQEGYRCRVLTL